MSLKIQRELEIENQREWSRKEEKTNKKKVTELMQEEKCVNEW